MRFGDRAHEADLLLQCWIQSHIFLPSTAFTPGPFRQKENGSVLEDVSVRLSLHMHISGVSMALGTLQSVIIPQLGFLWCEIISWFRLVRISSALWCSGNISAEWVQKQCCHLDSRCHVKWHWQIRSETFLSDLLSTTFKVPLLYCQFLVIPAGNKIFGGPYIP